MTLTSGDRGELEQLQPSTHFGPFFFSHFFYSPEITIRVLSGLLYLMNNDIQMFTNVGTNKWRKNSGPILLYIMVESILSTFG